MSNNQPKIDIKEVEKELEILARFLYQLYRKQKAIKNNK